MVAKRVHTHLLIDDVFSAIAEAKKELKKYPDSKILRLALMKALCIRGNEIEALEQWHQVIENHEEMLQDRVSLETLSWGALNKGETSNQLVVRVNALIGAAMTRDAKAIPLILKALRGSNSLLRSVAVSLAASYGDFPLQNEIARLLREEKVWYVRLELIKAIGQLGMTDLKEELIKIIGNTQTLAEEKVAAIVSFVNMYEKIEDRELDSLIHSNRAGLRELACEVITHLDLTHKVKELLTLLKDSHPQVRITALNALGLLGINQWENQPLFSIKNVENLLEDKVPEVVITASWLAMLCGDERGKKQLYHWAIHGEQRFARLATAAAAITGEKGIPLMKKILENSKDPFIQINLARGLISQRQEVEYACKIIDKHLTKEGFWMWENSLNPLFRSLAPSNVRHNPQIANYPSVMNQLTRLELLSLLCMMHYPKAQEAVKAFLQTHSWGVTGAAAATLLREGDDEALDVVRNLLTDSEEKIRIQAALILTMLGNDKTAVQVLKEAYSSADREIKLYILEAVSKVGDPETITFLLDRLSEPFQVMRVVAATAIIKCLYH